MATNCLFGRLPCWNTANIQTDSRDCAVLCCACCVSALRCYGDILSPLRYLTQHLSSAPHSSDSTYQLTTLDHATTLCLLFCHPFSRSHMTTTYDSRPLPVGGSRVPEGMEDHSDWRSLPEQEVKVVPSSEYGTEYVEAEQTRTGLGELKKAISAILPPVAAIDKNNALAAHPSTSDDKKAEIARLNAAETQRRDAAIAHLRTLAPLFPAQSPYPAAIDQVAERSVVSMDKEQFMRFQEYIKVQTTTIFREQNNLLQKMKALKKQKQ